MAPALSDTVRNVLFCPACRSSLTWEPAGSRCSGCGAVYLYTEQGTLDFRLKNTRPVTLTFNLGTRVPDAVGIDFKPLRKNHSAEIDYACVSVPRHLTEELLSYFPRARAADSLMLDLGCGNSIHRGVCEHAGFQYVGLDYSSPGAPIFGDAHALPFLDNSFEFILSVAVLEHIRYPFLMTAEAFRVLKSGGKLIGTVAFLEPFHLDSYYHHSHLGTLNSLQFAGFEVEQIAPSRTWTVLKAQASNCLFQGMPRSCSGPLVYPLHILHRLWWRLRLLKGERVSMNDLVRNSSGSFSFIAHKAQ